MNVNNFLGNIVAAALLTIVSLHVSHKVSDYTDNTLDNIRLVYKPLKSAPIRETVTVDARQLECMAMNMFFESRNQKTDDAMIAVGFTVLNRVASPKYPNTACEVVWQGRQDARGNYFRHKCQFSWVCDGKADKPNMRHPVEAAAWYRSKEIAVQVLMGVAPNPIGNATMYHAYYVNPRWAKAYEVVIQIEDHIFYQKV